MRYLWSCVVLCVGVGFAHGQTKSDANESFLEPFRAAATDRWEEDIQRLESRNETESYSANAILFLGSSSIRRWQSIAIDVAPYEPINRGYGGSKYSNLAVYAKRLIHPHAYRALVIFVGNDVKGEPTDHTPDQVEQFIRHILHVSRAHQPDAPVLLIEVTPTKKRWQAWPKIRQLNARIREIALSTPRTYFIATAEHFLDPDGESRLELFADDELHLNEDGYDLWSSLIRSRLDEVLRMETEFEARQEAAETP